MMSQIFKSSTEWNMTFAEFVNGFDIVNERDKAKFGLMGNLASFCATHCGE